MTETEDKGQAHVLEHRSTIAIGQNGPGIISIIEGTERLDHLTDMSECGSLFPEGIAYTLS